MLGNVKTAVKAKLWSNNLREHVFYSHHVLHLWIVQ